MKRAEARLLKPWIKNRPITARVCIGFVLPIVPLIVIAGLIYENRREIIETWVYGLTLVFLPWDWGGVKKK